MRTILLQCGGRKDEAPSLAANIKPGMLVEINSAGKLIPHGTADGFGGRQIAVEDALQGRTVDTVCDADEQVPFYHVDCDAKVAFRCKLGANYPAGTKLASAGTGSLQAAGAGTKQIFATVRTGVDLTAAVVDTLVECDVV